VFDLEIEKIGMSLRRLVGTDQAGEFVAPNDARSLISEEAWSPKLGVVNESRDPLPVRPAVEK
jgi:hypothetical protein